MGHVFKHPFHDQPWHGPTPPKWTALRLSFFSWLAEALERLRMRAWLQAECAVWMRCWTCGQWTRKRDPRPFGDRWHKTRLGRWTRWCPAMAHDEVARLAEPTPPGAGKE